MTPNGQRQQIQASNGRLVNRLTEAMIDWYTSLGLLDPRDYQADVDGFGYNPQIVPPYYRQAQKRGEAIPLYVNETQLRLYRDRSRKLLAENEFAICGVQNRVNYVVGEDGLKYRATAATPDCPPELLRAVQHIIDTFCELNCQPEIEQETLWRMDEDGEAFIRLFEADGGLLQERFVEPELIRSPVGDSFGPEHSFGIHTDPYDVEDVKGYWIVDAPLVNPMPSLIDGKEVIHFKRGTRRTAKRGIPIYYPVESELRMAVDLLVSMGSLAKTRAKFAVIRKLKGVAFNTAQSLISNLTTVTSTDPSTGQTLNMERRRPGDILSIPEDVVDYEFPNSEIDESGLVGILTAVVGAIAARLNMPPWMLLGDSQDASFATALVTEAPSTKNFLREQKYLSRRFGETRWRGQESLIWRQIRIAVQYGALPPAVYRQVQVQVEPPSLVTRDQAQEAEVNQVYLDLGLKSPQTISQEQGWDFDQEQANRKQLGLPSLKELSGVQTRKQSMSLPGELKRPLRPGAEQEPDEGEERPPGPGGPTRTE